MLSPTYLVGVENDPPSYPRIDRASRELEYNWGSGFSHRHLEKSIDDFLCRIVCYICFVA